MDVSAAGGAGSRVATVLEQDHRVIDEGFAAFVATAEQGRVDREPYDRAAEGLRRHIFVEEEALFPPLRAAGLVGPVLVMLREHGEIWDLLDTLDGLLAGGGAGPDDLLPVWRRLEDVLAQHNVKEERILYPAADQALSEVDLDDVRAALRDSVVPQGWASEMAGRSR